MHPTHLASGPEVRTPGHQGVTEGSRATMRRRQRGLTSHGRGEKSRTTFEILNLPGCVGYKALQGPATTDIKDAQLRGRFDLDALSGLNATRPGKPTVPTSGRDRSNPAHIQALFNEVGLKNSLPRIQIRLGFWSPAGCRQEDEADLVS